MSIDALYVPLEDGNLRIEPLREEHREALRSACAQDSEIWAIYPFCYVGEHFDPQFDSLLAGPPGRCVYVVLEDGEVVGMTARVVTSVGWLEAPPSSYAFGTLAAPSPLVRHVLSAEGASGLRFQPGLFRP